MIAETGSEAAPHPPVEITWVGGQKFDAGRPEGPKVLIDGNAEAGPSPFDALLAAVAACAATDVVEIMKKQRTPLDAMDVRVEATRVASVPRRLAAAVLHFTLTGPGITSNKAARAVELSVTKYCSVRSSLLADVSVTWTIAIQT